MQIPPRVTILLHQVQVQHPPPPARRRTETQLAQRPQGQTDNCEGKQTSKAPSLELLHLADTDPHPPPQAGKVRAVLLQSRFCEN